MIRRTVWERHKETILLNKNLIIADTCSLLISALFAQVVYIGLSEDSVLDSLLTALVEYCIDTPIFLVLYFHDHRFARTYETDPSTGIRISRPVSRKKEIKHILGIFSVCDIMYVIIKIFIQFQFLANIGVQPYEAAIISSLIAWFIFLFMINLTMHAARVFSKVELIWYYCLILTISIANSIIFFSNLSLRIFIDNIILDITAAVTLVASVLVVTRVYLDRKQERPVSKKVFPALVGGLALWFTAELTWTYYQVVRGISNPFPSPADAFWLTGYVFFGFALYAIFANLLKIGRTAASRLTNREHYLISALISVGVAIIVIVTYSYYAGGFQLDGEFLIALAYPLFDAVLLVPVITIIWSLRRVDPMHAHWILLCSFVILSAVGDIGFGYFELVTSESEEQTAWVWDTFFNSAYICLAAALLWYWKFNMPLFKSMREEAKAGRTW